MKWFRHMVNASDNGFIEAIEDKFGLEGYARYFKLLEVIARDMDKTDRCHTDHTMQKWCSFLKAKPNKLSSFLVHLENEAKIKVEDLGNVVRIFCPKLLELRDEYSRKSGQPPVAAPDKVAPDTETEAETDNPDDYAGVKSIYG